MKLINTNNHEIAANLMNDWQKQAKNNNKKDRMFL